MKSNSLQKNNIYNINENASSILLINLDSIVKNYNFLKTKANKSEIGVSVKANAYGLGLKKICSTLIKQGCNTFFVATVKEGLETIKIKKNLNVYVLNGAPNKKSAILLIKRGIKIVINNFQQLKDLINISNQINIKVSCAIHIDTGMNRLGLNIEETEDIVKLAKRGPQEDPE